MKIAGKSVNFKIKPNDFSGDFELQALNTSVMTNEMIAQLNINFLQAMSPYIEAIKEEGQSLNLPQIVKEIAYNFPGLAHRKNILQKAPAPTAEAMPGGSGQPTGMAPPPATPPITAEEIMGGMA